MELAFVKPEESGWRGRGAPRRTVPPHVVAMLQQAADSGDVGRIHVTDDTADDVKEALAALRAGARQIGRRLRTQQTAQDGRDFVLFQVGDKL